MARAAALTTVDQDIDAAKRLVLSMLTHHNMFVPISILPAGILARIFHVIAFSGEPYSLGWVHVTHVCRGWRQIALGDSTLWTRFSTSLGPRNKDWIAEQLSRARNAPLIIELDGSMGKDAFSLFTPHISHTRELYLRNLHSEIVQEISIHNAPALERLELSVSNAPQTGINWHSFFKAPLPKLRIFCVSQILLPWSLIPRGQLTELKVTLNKEVLISGVSQHDDLNQLIDLLVNCPALEVLTLENCMPATVTESSGGQAIHLPLLSRLCLGGSSSCVAGLLGMLKLSSSTTLRLNCTSENTPTQNEYLILSILSAHFNDPTTVKFRNFEINLNQGDRMLDMVASTSLPTSPILHTHVIRADTDIDAELSLSLSFPHVYDFNDVVDRILRRACEKLPISRLEFLFLSSFSLVRTQPAYWGEVFRYCTEVTTVQVCGFGTTSLLQALTPPPRPRGRGREKRRGNNGGGTRGQASNNNNNSDVSAPVQVPIFPKLTSLLLGRLDFNVEVPGSGVLHDLVLSAVKRRKAKKTPLSTLCITHCVISAEEAAVLEKIVPDFRWDHDEGEDEDDEDDYNHDYDYDYDYDNYYPSDYGPYGFEYDSDDHSDISDELRLGEVYSGPV